MNNIRTYTAVWSKAGDSNLRRLLVCTALLFLGLSVSAFAAGPGNGDPVTFVAYQVNIDTGPVALQIQGESTTQVVRITEEHIPAGVDVHLEKVSGILHITAAYSSSKKQVPLPATAKIYATMPRYEFVHITATSGAVTIDNLSTDHLTIQTGSGDIAVTNANAALQATSTSGNQSYDKIYGALDLTSTTGNLSFANFTGRMTLVSKAGSFTGQHVVLVANSSLRTSTGSIKVYLDYSLRSYTFDMESRTGKLTLGEINRTGAIRWGRGSVKVSSVTDSGPQDIQ